MFRVKCMCGEVSDISAPTQCRRCGNFLNTSLGGVLHLYRMGSPIGVAAGYGIYINGEPMGHIANTQSILIPLPFGTYTIHCTCGMTRRCQDLTFTITPDYPVVCAKARIKPGFWTNTIIVEPSSPDQMPPM